MARKAEMPKFDINDQDQLQKLYTSIYPGGSGPLGMMRVAAGLIEAIAKEKGFELHRGGNDSV